jgi:uncharacterized membrane protein YkvA (DUF1232 family)
MTIRERLSATAVMLKIQTWALIHACRDPETPWYAKAIAALVVAYALSPIDLIPDFIPVLGQLDDLLIVPLGIALSVKLVPQHVMERSRKKAMEQVNDRRPANWVMGGVIIALWVAIVAAVAFAVARRVFKK